MGILRICAVKDGIFCIGGVKREYEKNIIK